jgi:cyclophilin family peptidyl-prolyl cis-trans isomerase
MRLQLQRSVSNCARRVLALRRGIHSSLCAIACIAIVWAGTAVPVAAYTTVEFDLNYSTQGTSGLLDSFQLELYDDAAPITVANFLKYVNNGIYDNTIFHRNVSDFVVQGGGFAPTVTNGVTTALSAITNYGTIQNEYSDAHPNVSGTIAMAKVGGDANSATSQWFINVADNTTTLGSSNNGGYTVFGKVLGEGMTLINAINGLTTSDLSSKFGSTFNEVPVFNNGASLVTITKAFVVPVPPPTGTGKLSGCIYYDSNHDGVLDSGDVPIAGAKITITQNGYSIPAATVYTAADGSYNVGNLANGTFSVTLDTTGNGSGYDTSKGQMILDSNGTIISIGTSGTAQQDAYSNISLGTGQSGTNFNIAQSVFPIALLSVRNLLCSDPTLPVANQAVPGTNATSTTSGSSLAFGKVLVGKSADTTLTVTNLGADGSTLSGTFPGVSGDFSPSATSAFGPLDANKAADQQYTYTPTVRGSTTQGISVATDAGNVSVTLSGTGVAPVQKVATTAGLVRVGTTGSAKITITNTGDGNLSGLGAISNLQGTVAAGSGKFTGAGGSVSLADSASQTFSFTYTPASRGSDSSAIAVNFSNGSADGKNFAETVNATLNGQGVGPVLSSDAAGGKLDFGTIASADTKSLFLKITNSSTDSNGGDTTLTDLTLLDAQLSGTNAGLFSIAGFTAGSVLHESDSLTLEIKYNGAGQHGDRSAVLTILTDEGAALGASGTTYSYNISAVLAPEPSSFVMFAIAGLFAGGMVWRRKNA